MTSHSSHFHLSHPLAASVLSRRGFTGLALAGLGSFCTGCAVNPATGDQQVMLMSADEENRIGASEHPKILQEFGGAYEDPKVSGYIAAVGGHLAAASEMPDTRFTFTVLNSPIVNAMALPGGYVYVTRGLLALAQNEAEVAGVLGHEIGHVVARHTAARISRAQMTQFGLIGLAILGSAAGLPSGTGQLASTVATLHLQGYSREQEFEADMLGVRYLVRTGYDPAAMASFLGQLRAHSSLKAQIEGRSADSVDSFDIMATHPRTLDRIQRAAASVDLAPGHARNLHKAAYGSALDGMVFGNDPDAGVIRGTEFAHRALRFRFEVPDGFRLINRPDVVLAQDPQLRASIIFDLDRQRSHGAMETYITRNWAQSRLNDIQSLRVNGLPAATGWLRGNTKQGSVIVRLLAIRAEPQAIFRFTFVSPPSVTERLAVPFRRTTYSFRRLSQREADAIKPRRLVLHRLKRGEDPSSLVGRMNVDSYREGWFELLNGFASGHRPKPGDPVRLVR